ncbi:hypothetical protein PPYR_14812 [Photinus pyralis]|uniref:Gustatory receptor n=1 Tax=Photinus pyralis TaxID=7054 RepID=A0A5N4A6A9_PHOPY|nr:hypothetical protein PPYR_14812 [Photinus pyralis]
MNYRTNIATIHVDNLKIVEPLKIEPIAAKSPEDDSCFCLSASPILLIAKLFGLFPITSRHVKGQCTYSKSKIWLIYSIVIFLIYLSHVFMTTDLLRFDKNKPLPELLSAINDIMYAIFVAILTIISILRYPRFVKMLNTLVPLVKDAGLVCPSALASLRRVQYGYLTLFFAEMSVQYGVLIGVHYSDRYATNFDYNMFIHVGVKNIPFVFYLLFFLFCSAFISVLACFEKLIISALKFTPVHPSNNIDETNNKRDFIGLIKYEVCKQDHKCFGKMMDLTQAELVEHLRALHEDISLVIYDFNACMNPQLLFHSIVELAVLIIHWYEVLIYTSYTFSSPFASAINFVNWTFVIAHSVGLFLFLKSAQDLKNMTHGLTNFLLEYSTRITDPEEHQQVRIFIEKLQQHRPITASGVFNVDLGIAGPIAANILTYVLVALQFDIPKN